MKRRQRLFTVLLLSALLVSLAPAPAFGAGLDGFRDNADFLQGFAARENALEIFLAAQEEQTPEAGRFAASLEGSETPVSSVRTAESYPVTYYCLADVSGSLDSAQLAQEKEVLLGLCDRLSEGDQMVVVTVGNEAAASGYLTNKEEIAGVIDALAVTPDDTNLYAAIAESIRVLNGSNNANRRRCLVVLSDGEDYQQSGQTKSDADRAIQDTRIPVYTVALMRQANVRSEKWLEFAKLLGSLARESVGGVHFNPTLDGTECGSVGGSIASNMKNDLVLTLELSAFAPEKEELTLLVSYETSDGATYGDSMTVYRQNLNLVPAEETLYPLTLTLKDETGEAVPAGTAITLTAGDGTVYQAAAEDGGTASFLLPEGSYALSAEGYTVPEGTVIAAGAEGETAFAVELERAWQTGPEPEPKKTWLWIAAAAAVLLAVVIAVLAANRKKKAAAEEALRRAEEEAAERAAIERQETPGTVETAPLEMPAAPEPERPKARVLFTAIGYEQICFELKIEKDRELTLGRDGRADLVLNPNDKKLSGVNSRLLCSGRSLRVWDAGSTNGTAVNGVPLNSGASAIVEDGQTLRVGDYEYRVQFVEG